MSALEVLYGYDKILIIVFDLFIEKVRALRFQLGAVHGHVRATSLRLTGTSVLPTLPDVPNQRILAVVVAPFVAKSLCRLVSPVVSWLRAPVFRRFTYLRPFCRVCESYTTSTII